MSKISEPISYDELPYESKPFPATHPDNIGAVAELMGMNPPPVNGCRVLELGCAAGWNLIPMAAGAPDSTFVGIDLSPRQIDDGLRVVEDLELSNLSLHTLDLMDLDDAFVEAVGGPFDYIVAHGVYSWVPPHVQQRILELYQRLLVPQGVGYISYNTFPGWHLRRITRDIMLYHQRCLKRSDHHLDARGQLRQARALLDFLKHAVSPSAKHYAEIVKAEVEDVINSTDSYIYHEHLETNNLPVYFHEFAAQLAGTRLKYLEEAWPVARMARVPPDYHATLQGLAHNRIELEQFLDFLFNRTFRRSLICHEAAQINDFLDNAVTERLFASGLAFPEGEVDLAPGKVVKFVFGSSSAVSSTNHPWIKSILLTLFETWPDTCSFDEIAAAIQTGVGSVEGLPAVSSSDGRKALKQVIMQCYQSELLLLHTQAARCVTTISERPNSTKVSRYQAAQGELVTNLRHVLTELVPWDRELLVRLDGSRDRDALVGEMRQAMHSGQVHVTRDEQQIAESDLSDDDLQGLVVSGLERLAKSSLLCG